MLADGKKGMPHVVNAVVCRSLELSWPIPRLKISKICVCPQFPYRGNDTVFWIFPIVRCDAFCM